MAVVLAGGLARRMGGGDKCLKLLAGRPILAHVLERLDGQAERILLNANGDPRVSHRGAAGRRRRRRGFGGPLVGVLTALEWAAAHAPDITDVAERAGRRSVSAARPGRLPRGAARMAVNAELAGAGRAAGPTRWSGYGPFHWPPRCVTRWSRRRSRRSMPGPAATPWRPSFRRRSGRSVLQCQYTGRPDRGGALAAVAGVVVAPARFTAAQPRLVRRSFLRASSGPTMRTFIASRILTARSTSWPFDASSPLER